MGGIKSKFRKTNYVSENINYYSIPWGVNTTNVPLSCSNDAQYYPFGQNLNEGIPPANFQQIGAPYPQESLYNGVNCIENGLGLGLGFLQHPQMSEYYPMIPAQQNYVDINYGPQSVQGVPPSMPLQFNSGTFLPPSFQSNYNQGIETHQPFVPPLEQFIQEYNYASQMIQPGQQPLNYSSQTVYPGHQPSNYSSQTIYPDHQLSNYSSQIIQPGQQSLNYSSQTVYPGQQLLNYSSQTLYPSHQPSNYSSQTIYPSQRPSNYSSQTIYPSQRPSNYPSQKIYHSQQPSMTLAAVYPSKQRSNISHQTQNSTAQSYNTHYYPKTVTLQTTRHYSNANPVSSNNNVEYDTFTSLSGFSHYAGGV
jgi:hypothetical protein